MKRKIKLRGELVIIMLISLAISLSVAIVIRNKGIGFERNNETTRIDKVYSEGITELKKDLMNCDLKNNVHKVQKIIHKKYSFQVGYEFYIVDATGEVLTGSNHGILKIDSAEIVDGRYEYTISKKDKNVFKVTGCDYLKDNQYLYYTYLKYDEDDTGMLTVALIGALVCFLYLIWGRVSYISDIRKAVDKIAKGDLAHRVPCKYHNELRELAENINYMADSLDSEEQKKNEFLTNISHDIRTPLTTILGYLDMIKDGKYDSREELDTYMNIMKGKGTFLASMLEDFFQYSKLNSSDIKMNYEKFELNELLRQFYEEEEDQFKENTLTLRSELYEKPIYCNGDTELLARVLNNLLANALKYSKRDSTVFMKSATEKVDHVSYGVFTISNVPKEEITEQEIELLFHRLYKRDNSRSEEGSGLGLSIVNSIVRLHGGMVKGYKEGEKLIFKVLLRL
ncbi:HAMP domain-containing sensor histidine kinase [Anaeromicropila herbilytica]|uniref:histidine kinase n=1 Tax=Anaeromicropila herbilytica TaxID=2785025 RepID=A0A7R7EQ63_9FIRM|nr:HAMP domain-containing sensor histidine kinase [Anaeromicropila herbilytica]BCN32894.1 two-component sensor histidine kinase [Anaeromicropila herbilytica]